MNSEHKLPVDMDYLVLVAEEWLKRDKEDRFKQEELELPWDGLVR